MSGMYLNKLARVVEGHDERFHHIFGGPSKYMGTTPTGCAKPLHLVYTFDTNDEAFPWQIPGVRYLPLFYSFPYNAGACGYKVKSENEIEILYMETKKIEPNFPYENYPSEFPEREVRLLPISYEQHKTLVFYLETDKESLSIEDRRLIFEEFDYPFTQLGGIHRMWQGLPEISCPNKSCESSQYSSMEVFAVIWNQPHKNVFLWDNEDPDGCDIQVIFQICPECGTIHACNRCT
jgi:hypothetical protein